MGIVSWLRKTDKYKGKIMGFACSYGGAKILGIIDGATGIKGLLENGKVLLDYCLPSNILMYTLIVGTIVVYSLNFIFKKIVNAQKPSQIFKNIMKEHTAVEISDLSDKTYSWGYNYCLFYSPNPLGWSPNIFFIGEYDDKIYNFGKEQKNLPDYYQDMYEEYCKISEKVKAIERKGDNRERFAVGHIKPNTHKTKPKFEIKLKKTSWAQLQYSWDYFRLLTNNNEPETNKMHKDFIVQKLKDAYDGQGGKYHINSFCLHLLIETKKGVVLSRIGKGKANDYPSSWAATIGEQIEEIDFYSVKGQVTSFKEDFIECWVKRAIEEEFGIDRDSEYDDIFDGNSLRVLSIDMEADIYNIALTCVIKLKKDFEEFSLEVKDKKDSIENYELCELSAEEILDVLLGYPENRRDYHPSTYLRLMMYYRYKKGTDALNADLVKRVAKTAKKSIKSEQKQ